MSLLNGYIYNIVARIGLAGNVPTLLPGEIGYDTDTKTFRVGDDTPSPPRVPTTKSTGTFDFQAATTWILPGNVPVTGGKVDGVDISTLNTSNGIICRTDDGAFSPRSIVSGDSSLTISNATGSGGNIDIRLSEALIAAVSAGVTDGDKGDITVSGGVWNIDPGVVGTTELANEGVTDAKLATLKWDRVDITFVNFTTNEPALSLGNAGKSFVNTTTGTGNISTLVTFTANVIYTVNAAGNAWLTRNPAHGSIVVRDTSNEKLYKRIADGTWVDIVGTAAVADDSVTNAMLANMVAYTYKMRNAGTTGDPQDINQKDLTVENSPAIARLVVTFDASTGEPKVTTIDKLATVLRSQTYLSGTFSSGAQIDKVAALVSVAGGTAVTSGDILGGAAIDLPAGYRGNISLHIPRMASGSGTFELEVSKDAGSNWVSMVGAENKSIGSYSRNVWLSIHDLVASNSWGIWAALSSYGSDFNHDNKAEVGAGHHYLMIKHYRMVANHANNGAVRTVNSSSDADGIIYNSVLDYASTVALKVRVRIASGSGTIGTGGVLLCRT